MIVCMYGQVLVRHVAFQFSHIMIFLCLVIKLIHGLSIVIIVLR